MSLTRD